jgi:serine/threonine protein kinase
MGEVYRATDTRLGRAAAIKSLPPALAGDPDSLVRFDREARLLASINHPNIAAVYGLERVDGLPFLVMELVEGEDLAERLARGPIPLQEALPLARQIADAVARTSIAIAPDPARPGRRSRCRGDRNGTVHDVESGSA